MWDLNHDGDLVLPTHAKFALCHIGGRQLRDMETSELDLVGLKPDTFYSILPLHYQISFFSCIYLDLFQYVSDN